LEAVAVLLAEAADARVAGALALLALLAEALLAEALLAEAFPALLPDALLADALPADPLLADALLADPLPPEALLPDALLAAAPAPARRPVPAEPDLAPLDRAADAERPRAAVLPAARAPRAARPAVVPVERASVVAGGSGAAGVPAEAPAGVLPALLALDPARLACGIEISLWKRGLQRGPYRRSARPATTGRDCMLTPTGIGLGSRSHRASPAPRGEVPMDMQEDPEIHDDLAVHIRAAARPDGETARLARALNRACWPSGAQDSTDPVARGWLRMWGPTKIVVDVPECGCAVGRCTICN
jgi:hypothetical protein